MDPLLLLLFGMIIVLGGILILRLHPFLALLLGALIIGGLTPQSNLEKFTQSKNFSAEQTQTLVEKSLKMWDKAGYKRPKIVYWNLVSYGGQPDTVDSKDIALVSGFSPSILKSILACDDFSPRGIMLEVLKRYNMVKSPERM